MNIWVIVLGEPIPLDSNKIRLHRAGMLTQELTNRGHNVKFWTSNVDHFNKIKRSEKNRITKLNDNYSIIELSGRLYKKNISFARILHNIDVTKEFKKLLNTQEKPDVIICNYPIIELSEAAINYGIKNKIPTIVDIRDFWPDIFYETLPKSLHFLGSIIFFPWENKTKNIIKNVTAVTGITDAAIEWARNKNNQKIQPQDKSFHLAYEKREDFIYDKDFLNKFDIDPSKYQIYFFCGTLSKRIELKTMALAAKILEEKNYSKIRLVICGSGEMLESLREDVKTCQQIILPGWIEKDQINTLLSISKAGILPYPSSLDFIRSYPNKVGEYLSRNLPILSSVKGEMQTLLNEWKCGITYENNCPESLVKAIEFLEQNEGARQDMAKNAESCFKEKFDSKIVYKNYVSFIEACKV